MRTDAIREFVERIPATLKEKRGVYSVEFTVAERKAFLAKKRLTYSARFRIDDEKKELRFTEMLIESGAGLSSGDETGPGFGLKREITKTGAGPAMARSKSSRSFSARSTRTRSSSRRCEPSSRPRPPRQATHWSTASRRPACRDLDGLRRDREQSGCGPAASA